MVSIRNIFDKLRTTMWCEVLLTYYYPIFMFVLSSAGGNMRSKEKGHVMKQQFKIVQTVTDDLNLSLKTRSL